MKTGQYIALFGKGGEISAAQRRVATLAGAAIAETGFGCLVDKLSGAMSYALRSHKEAGGITMAVLEPAHSSLDRQCCDIMFVAQDTQSVYERIAASTVGAIFLGLPTETLAAIQPFQCQGKPVIVIGEANDECVSGKDTSNHESLIAGLCVFPATEMKKAISQLRETAIAV